MAFLLILFGSVLAFWIECTTPAPGIGCRALTILVYTGAQFVSVILSAWSHFKVAHDDQYWEDDNWLDGLRSKSFGILVSILVLVPAWIFAMFITFAGTLMQITRIFENCWCTSNFDHTIVSLAGDT